MRPMILTAVLSLSVGIGLCAGQEPDTGVPDHGVKEQLDKSLAELAALRQRIADEKIPLAEKLQEAEKKLLASREGYEDVKRSLDRRNLDMNNLRTEIKSREQENNYLSSLLGEYTRNMESRLHISELKRHQQVIEKARLAPENSNLPPAEVFNIQAELVRASISRLVELLGGVRFSGRAAGEDGLVKDGQFALLGPVAFFVSSDEKLAGMVEQRLGSLEPSVVEFTLPEHRQATLDLIRNTQGRMPLDTSLGNARKIEETKETLKEHIIKGGLLMYPIIASGFIMLLYAVPKLLSLIILWARLPNRDRIQPLLDAIASSNKDQATLIARAFGGPAGRMLRAGVSHMGEPRELIEEVMFEIMLDAKFRLKGLIPFVAVCAASAPLMGLLGTVLGIITTFKMLTVFGGGDVKALSGGISEALITTEAGLVLAIPALVFHATLAWVVRGYTDKMEALAVAFLGVETKRTHASTSQCQALQEENPDAPACLVPAR